MRKHLPPHGVDCQCEDPIEKLAPRFIGTKFLRQFGIDRDLITMHVPEETDAMLACCEILEWNIPLSKEKFEIPFCKRLFTA